MERLRKLVGIAGLEGVRVGIRSQVGRLSEDPDTVTVLCNNVDGLGLTLDPSHYICRPEGKPVKYDKLIKYVYHVHLRDSRKDQLQVRIGQGLSERVAYRELFLFGLTHLDLKRIPKLARMQARTGQEILRLVDDLALPRREVPGKYAEIRVKPKVGRETAQAFSASLYASMQPLAQPETETQAL